MLITKIPEWDNIEVAFRKIFKRKWYTNHGPLVQKLEKELENYFEAKHVICMTNYAIALAIAEKAGEGINLEVFNLYPSISIVSSACVYTDSDQIAARLRNMRSSYGAGHKVDIPLTGNGRMSEAQAAMVLIGLDHSG